MMRYRRPLLSLLLLLLVGTGTATGSQDELTMWDVAAFAIGTDINVESVEELDASALSDSLAALRERHPEIADDPILAAHRLSGVPVLGPRRSVIVEYSPTEWEPGRPFRHVRVALEDRGWLDDSVAGRRAVLWFVPDEQGRLTVARALRADLCRRPYWKYYSAKRCP